MAELVVVLVLEEPPGLELVLDEVLELLLEPPELGEEAVLVVSFVVLELLLLPPPAGLTTVVLFSVFFSAGGFTVSLFCSHAARSAAPARMQMYFFISCRCSCPCWVKA